MLPNRSLALMMLRRGLRLWLIARAAIGGLVFLAGDDPFRLPTITTVCVLLLCMTLGQVEVHLNHERDLLGNLGIKRRGVAGLLLGPALAGELIVHLIAGTL